MFERFINWLFSTTCSSCHKYIGLSEQYPDPVFGKIMLCKECHQKEALEMKRKNQAFYDNFVDWSAPDYFGE